MSEFDYSSENIKKTIEEDYFSRNRYLLRLIDLIEKSNECSMYAIDGRWGCGKTVFMHQLLNLLNDNETYSLCCKKMNCPMCDIDKVECYYFNAWENDLINNPALNLLKSLIDQYSLFSTDDRDKYSTLLTVLKNISVKVITAGMFSGSDFCKTENEYYSPISEIKNSLNQIIDIIKKTKKVKKIVIIIDELDRCRPNYAVNLLESLKHFYDNEDLVFLVSTDMIQLAHSVRNLYGEGFDGDLYLERFFKGIFTLSNLNYEKYIENELNYHIMDTYILNDCCKLVINYYDLSIREVIKLIKQISLLEYEFSRNCFNKYISVAKFLFVPWGLGIKYKSNKLFNEFRTGKIKKESFVDYLNSNPSLASWLKECLYRDKIPDNTVFEDVMYELYCYIFSSDKLKYYPVKVEDVKFDNFNKETIRSLIDF